MALIITDDIIPIPNNNDILYVRKKNNGSNFRDTRYKILELGIYFGINKSWIPVTSGSVSSNTPTQTIDITKLTSIKDITAFTFDGIDELEIVTKDGSSFKVNITDLTLNELTVGNVNSSGTITAVSFVGDGSSLTNISSDSVGSDLYLFYNY